MLFLVHVAASLFTTTLRTGYIGGCSALQHSTVHYRRTSPVFAAADVSNSDEDSVDAEVLPPLETAASGSSGEGFSDAQLLRALETDGGSGVDEDLVDADLMPAEAEVSTPTLLNAMSRLEDIEAHIADLRRQLDAVDDNALKGFDLRTQLEYALSESLDVLKEAGMSDEQIAERLGDKVEMEDEAEQASPVGRPGSCPPAPAPTSGEESWGRWSHNPSEIYLELLLDADDPDVPSIKTKGLVVDVAEGFLCVGRDVDAAVDEGLDVSPIVFGRLLQPVLVDELNWAVDEDRDGRRVLCVELPKKKTQSAGSSARVDCCFDETLHIHGEPVLVAGLSQGTITYNIPERPETMTDADRSGSGVVMSLADDGRIDVSDLGLTMEDLEAPMPELLGDGTLSNSGYESTSRLESSKDQGCAWSETADGVEATITLAGLRGQPAGSLAVDLTETTATVTAFGQAVWSCVMRGEIEVERSSAQASDGEGMVPVLRIIVQKRPGSARWAGFVREIGEDSILQ